MNYVFLIPGIVFGVAEFFLLRAIISRAMSGRSFLVALIVKLLSYAAVLVPVLMLRNTQYTLYFGIGAGGALLLTAIIWFIVYSLKQKNIEER